MKESIINNMKNFFNNFDAFHLKNLVYIKKI